MRYQQLAIDFALCPRTGCPICGQSSSSSTEDARVAQEQLDAATACFDRYQCWGQEIASQPGVSVRQLETRNDFATKAYCSGCQVTAFLPCPQLGKCPRDIQVDVNWVLVVAILEGLGLLVLLYLYCRLYRQNKNVAMMAEAHYQPLSGIPLTRDSANAESQQRA